jgi:phage baseplate assembly protein W
MHLHHPYGFNGHGATATADEAAWIRGLIEQVIFTTPGERLMLPDFGSGLMQLVFAPNSPALASTTQFLVQGALQRWLGDLITLEAVDVEAEEASLRVSVRYTILRSQTPQSAVFERTGGAA